jgi:protoporphyrin/coproporphyrin ferrochelatase
MKKIAVVLLNLGGPDNLEAVEPFLFNLFNDKEIITMPQPFRYLLAKLISKLRKKKAMEIYRSLGGRSPILENTLEQAMELERALEKQEDTYKVFVCMRHWHPFSYEVVEKIENFNPEKIILLPLYPHMASSTTKSAINDIKTGLIKKHIKAEIREIGCYPKEKNMIKSFVKKISASYEEIEDKSNVRLLFSAHSLPIKAIIGGDPYQEHIKQTVNEIIKEMNLENLDWVICYQSKVAYGKWLFPYTDDEIRRAAEEKKSIIMIPVSFVSEHSETLVELDIQYKELAEQTGIRQYIRVPTLSVDKDFINCLKSLCIKTTQPENKELCHKNFKNCICKGEK